MRRIARVNPYHVFSSRKMATTAERDLRVTSGMPITEVPDAATKKDLAHKQDILHSAVMTCNKEWKNLVFDPFPVENRTGQLAKMSSPTAIKVFKKERIGTMKAASLVFLIMPPVASFSRGVEWGIARAQKKRLGQLYRISRDEISLQQLERIAQRAKAEMGVELSSLDYPTCWNVVSIDKVPATSLIKGHEPEDNSLDQVRYAVISDEPKEVFEKDLVGYPGLVVVPKSDDDVYAYFKQEINRFAGIWHQAHAQLISGIRGDQTSSFSKK